MSATEIHRRDAVLREVEIRSRRRASGLKARRVATLRAASALRLAASTGSRTDRS